MGCCAKYILICAASAVFWVVWHAVNAADIREASWIILIRKKKKLHLKKIIAVFHDYSTVPENTINSIFMYTHIKKKDLMHLNMYISLNAHIFACMWSQIFSSIT